MEESAMVNSLHTGDHPMHLLMPSHGEQDIDRAGAGEQNGSSDAKKQSSSSQAETNLAEEQQRSLTVSTSDQFGTSSDELKKPSSSGSIPSSNSQRTVRKATDRLGEVKERRRQLEEKRQAALKKQISEKEKRRQRALEVKGSKQPSARVTSKRVIEMPSIYVEIASPEPNEPRSRSKRKPVPILINPSERVTSPKSSTPTSPLSPKSSPSFKTSSKPGTPRRTTPPQAGMPRKTSPIYKAPPPSSKSAQAKKIVAPPKRPVRRVKKQKDVTQPPSIPEVKEPTGSEDDSITDEKFESYSSIAELCIYYNESKSQERSVSPTAGTDSLKEETHHQRRLTLQERSSDCGSERKCSHPNIKFPENVEFTEKPTSQLKITSHEIERRQKKEYKPRQSAVAFMGSMRQTTLEQPPEFGTPISAPVSRVTTPNTSRSNSPKRHVSAVVQPTTPKHSPLLHRKTSDEDTKAAAPPYQAMGTRRHLVSDDKSLSEQVEKSSATKEDGESSSGRPSLEFPASCFELRPQEACLYTILNEGSIMEKEVFKMVLSDEQIDRIAEVYLLPNSLQQLLMIVPKVQEYLDEGVTTFKILSATESDGSRCSFIIGSATEPLSSTSSSSSGVSLSTFDF